MYERAWKAVSESPAVFSPLWKVLGVVLLAWTVLNVICYSTVGCLVAGFNPWALRFYGIHVRGKLKIKSIRYNIWKHRIVVDTAEWIGDLDLDSVGKKNEDRKSRGVSVPKKLIKWLPFIAKKLDRLKIVFDGTQVGDVYVSLAVIKLVSDGSKISLEMNVQRAMIKNKCVLGSAGFKFDALIDTSRPFPFKEIFIDVEARETYVSAQSVLLALHERKYGKLDNDDPVRAIEKHQADKQAKQTSETDFTDINKFLEVLNEKVEKFYTVSSSFEKISLVLESPLLSNIPLKPSLSLIKSTQALQLQISATSIAICISRSSFTDPGTKLLFGSEERPLKFSTYVVALKISLLTKKGILKEQSLPRTEELRICEIPNISLYGDTNLFCQDCIVREDTKLFYNTVLKLVGHVTSPVLDLDIQTLSLLVSVQRNLKVLSELLSQDPIEKPLDLKEIYQEIAKRGQFIEYFQNYLPHTELKINIDDPVYIISNGVDSLVQKLSAIKITVQSNRVYQQSEKKLFYSLDTQMDLIEWTGHHQNEDHSLKQDMFSSSNICLSFSTRILPSLLLSASLQFDNFHMDLTNLKTLVVINDTMRQRNMKLSYVEDTYFKEIFQNLESRLMARIEHFKKHTSNGESVNVNDLIFEDLPPFFESITVQVKNLIAIVGSRSVFIERNDYMNPNFETAHDFVSGEMRKISYSLADMKAIFARVNDSMNADSNSSSMLEKLDTFASDDKGLGRAVNEEKGTESGPWSLDFSISDLSVELFSETLRDSLKLIPKPVLKLPTFKFYVYPDQELKRIKAAIDISNVDLLFSLMTVFLFFSSIYNLKMVFGNDVYPSASECIVSKHMETLKELKKRRLVSFSKADLVNMLDFNFNLAQSSTIILLPNGLRTKLELIDTSVIFTDGCIISTSGHYTRLMVESPILKNTWMRMITIVNYKMDSDLSLIKDKSDKVGITLSNESWQWTIPHKFEMYKLFDNISTVYKSIKQMDYSLKTESNKSVIYPKITHPSAIPKIKLKSSRWIFSVEDDPFESELNIILQLGLREQKERLEKYDIFRKRVENEFRKKDAKVLRKASTFMSDTKSNGTKIFKSRSNSSFHLLGLEPADLQRADGLADRLKEEYDTLARNISKSWIVRVKKHKNIIKDHFTENFEFLWGTVDVTKLPKNFNSNVLEFTSNPSLMNLILEGIDIELSEPSFGINNIPEFIHDVGKGVPKDTEYSIMIPLKLDAKFTEIRCHLKDYPLPALYFPKNTANPVQPSTNLICDLLITEDMIHSEKELRTIYVPLVPSAHLEDSTSLYALLVPRTITSIKVFTDLKLENTSTENTRIVWGSSYGGAIQQTMDCFDNFSKPPIDPSPAVGFWDKIRNMFHARLHVSIPNSAFEVALKGDKNPHKIGGMSAGYALIFKDNVNICFNKDDNPKKFVTINASELSFSVPNFFAKPIPAWNMPSEKALFFPVEEFSNLQANASFYYLLDSARMPKSDKMLHIMRKAYIEKTAIKLTGGMEFNVGIMFERYSDRMKKRTFDLKPHYDFRLCNPIYVDQPSKHDSYAGFRSDFIHLSFELISKGENAYNCMQLTPNAFKIFFKWWGSFSGNLPVRKGPLFTHQRISPKFGTHLYTISYRADVFPLFICHMVPNLDPRTLIDPSLKVEVFGLKAKMSEFSMDLHQRKEVFHEYKEHLNVTKKITSLKFHSADVTTTDIDIRTVFAKFMRPEYAKKNTPNLNIFDNDQSWFDIYDYSEFNYANFETSVPSVVMSPLLFSPMFAYKKHAPYGNKYQVDVETFEPIEPFDNFNYHNCNLKRYVVIPDRLVNERIKIFAKEKNELDAEIRLSRPTNSKLLERLKMVNRTLEQLELMKSDIKYLNNEYNRADCEHSKAVIDRSELNLPNWKLMRTSQDSDKSYANKFIVVSMLLKWNEEVRNVFLKYIHRLTLISDMNNVTKLKTLQTLDSLIEKNRLSVSTIPEEAEINTEKKESANEYIFKNIFRTDKDPEQILLSFHDDIKLLGGDFDYSTFEKYHVQLIAPQIQLTTATDPDACVLVTAPTIKLNSLYFDSNITDNEYQQNIFMNRAGIQLIQSNVFVFHKMNQESYNHLLFDKFLYGSTNETSWRPWLGLELCFNPENLKDDMLISNFTSVFTYDQVLPFANIPDKLKHSDVLKNRIICDLPRIVIESNSARYLSLFNLVTSLLLYVEPESAKMKNDIKKLILSFDFEDVTKVKEAIMVLEKQIDILDEIEYEYSFKKYLLDDAEKSDLNTIRHNKMDTAIKMLLMMKVITSASPEQDSNEEMLYVIIKAKEVILHMLDDDRHNFLDVAVADATFQRMETPSGYNFNKLNIEMAQVINLSHDALFHDLLSPVQKNVNRDQKPLLELKWEKDKAVGGIQVVKNVVTNLRDLKINVEEPTIEKIIAWVSPSSVSTLMDGINQQEVADGDLDESASSGSTSRLSVKSVRPSNVKAQSIDRVRRVTPSEMVSPMEEVIGNDAEMDEMIQRSKENMIIENITINPFLMVISYQGSGVSSLINVTDFNLYFPTIRFANETMTVLDLMMHLKKVLIKSLLRHTGSFIGNKLKKHGSVKKLRTAARSPLKQLNYYKHYTTVDELKDTSSSSTVRDDKNI